MMLGQEPSEAHPAQSAPEGHRKVVKPTAHALIGLLRQCHHGMGIRFTMVGLLFNESLHPPRTYRLHQGGVVALRLVRIGERQCP